MSKYQSDTSPTLLRLNVSGREYDIPESVARSHVGSVFALLAGMGSKSPEFANPRILTMRRIFSIQQRWFAERSPSMFEIVLQYLYTRHLHCPVSVCEHAVKDELKFWRLENVPMAECCRAEDYQDIDDEFDSNDFDESEDRDGVNDDNMEKGVMDKEMTQKEQTHLQQRAMSNGKRLSFTNTLKLGLSDKRRRWQKCTHFLWRICHGPSSWIPARIFNGFCILFILVSIVNLILSTLPELQCPDNTTVIPPANLTTPQNPSTSQPNSSTTAAPQLLSSDSGGKFDHNCTISFAFDIIEAICIAWFTLELTLRFISFPDKRLFLKKPMNIIDILATAPYYVELVLRLVGANTSSLSTIMVALRILRMLRIFRVLRLARYFHSLKLFGSTIAKSKNELGVLILFLLLSMVIFSSLMYYLEKDVDNSPYTSIPASFYWAVVTLTTTGYGDVTPKSPLGKTLAGLACVAGVLVLALPVSILVEHFNEAYKAKRARRRRQLDQKQLVANPMTEFQYSASPRGDTQSPRGGHVISRSCSTISEVRGSQSTDGNTTAVLPDTLGKKSKKSSASSTSAKSAARLFHKRTSEKDSPRNQMSP